MNYTKLPYEALKRFSADTYVKHGFAPEDSEKIADVILRADLYGFESHGVQRLIRYHVSIQGGNIDAKAEPEIIFETPLSACVDAHKGPGQKMALFATDLAIQKAKEHGAGFVTVKNANHYGIASYYSQRIAEADMIGFSFTNSEAMMVPTFGRQAMLGSNPIAIAMPADPYMFSFDAATTVVPRGKVEVYNKQEKPLQEGWAVDSKGLICTDASEVLHNIINKIDGGILPTGGADPLFGSHKGYGFGVFCEIFSSILAGGPTSNHWVRGESSHSFIAIDYGMFGDKTEIKARMSTLLQEIRDSKKAEGQDRIYTHGEKEFESAKEKLENGIPVNDKTIAELRKIADDLGMDYESYFGA